MHDPKSTIDTIAYWNLAHPKPVQQILDAYAALTAAQTEAPGWEGLTDPKKVVQTIRGQVQYALATGEAADAAVRTARFKISKALVAQVAEHLEAYLSQLEPGFNKAVEVYEEAIEKLPREFGANDVAVFEQDQFKAYADAKQAVAEINAAKAWALSLSGLIPGQVYDVQNVATEFLVLDPGSVEGYATVQLAETKGHDAAYSAIAPTLAKAVNAGAVLRLALPSEAKEDVDRYETQRQEMHAHEWTKIRSSVIV